MSLIEKNFSRNKSESLQLIKRLQRATRTLQRICNEVKVSENLAMAKHVPTLKKCLEDLIVRVKAMCVANNCLEAFEVAVLKNKTVKGDTIPEAMEEEEETETEEGYEEEEEGEEEDDPEAEDEDEELDNSGEFSRVI